MEFAKSNDPSRSMEAIMKNDFTELKKIGIEIAALGSAMRSKGKSLLSSFLTDLNQIATMASTVKNVINSLLEAAKNAAREAGAKMARELLAYFSKKSNIITLGFPIGKRAIYKDNPAANWKKTKVKD